MNDHRLRRQNIAIGHPLWLFRTHILAIHAAPPRLAAPASANLPVARPLRFLESAVAQALDMRRVMPAGLTNRYDNAPEKHTVYLRAGSLQRGVSTGDKVPAATQSPREGRAAAPPARMIGP